MLISGVNLFALALIIHALMLGWSIAGWRSWLLRHCSCSSTSRSAASPRAIYNEVLQFFVIIAGLVPLVIIGLKDVGGWSGLQAKVDHTKLGASAFSSWSGVGVGHWTNPLGDWIGIVFGLGFVLSFGYWTTNFAEVQRALSAKDLSAAQRTPLIGAYPKIFIPALTIIPGLIALVVIPKLGGAKITYNEAIPALMGKYLPNGALGVALAGLLAAFMAGMAANVSSFNTVVTYDLWQTYIRRGRPDRYYLQVGRVVTVVGIVIGVGTAFIASGYNNIQNYIQLLFSFFNAPLFATFILAMFWKRTTPWSGIAGLAAGTIGAAAMHFAGYHIAYFYPHQVLDPTHATINAQMVNFYGAIAAFVADLVVTVLVTLVTKPKPVSELAGLVWGVPDPNAPDPATVPKPAWWASPKLLGGVALGIVLVLSIVFA